MKICTILGARPQFIKASVVSSAFASTKRISEILIHTGQHYAKSMSDIFFEELGIPKVKYNLNIGSGPHGEQTGKMLEALEKKLLHETPDMVMVYGDTNSTLAGALASSKLNIPVIHVEAGMRSFNRSMPEEINRVITDHIAKYNFCSNQIAVKHLTMEGRRHTATLVGDVMYDCSIKYGEVAEQKYPDLLKKYSLRPNNYFLVTCHRAGNTDDKENLNEIFMALNNLSRIKPVLFPLHPRTRNKISEYSICPAREIMLTEPIGYLEMLILEKKASVILTDSGGIQKEAFFYNVPCVTMREETEWTETVSLNWNILAGANSRKIEQAVKYFLINRPIPSEEKPYGDGNAAGKILKAILDIHTSSNKKAAP